MKLEQLKVFIVGLGQIGGSIARVLTEKNLVSDVHGFDIDKSVTNRAKERGHINNQAESITDGVDKADLIILATPIRTTIKLIPEIIKQAKTNQAILDVAGVQAGILEIVSRLNAQINYISGHPIAGNEKAGLEAATVDKFEKTSFFLSPAKPTKKEWIDIAGKLIVALGAKPIFIDPEKHDLLISTTSNLPYLLAITLMNLAFKQDNFYKDIWQLAGGSFKSATRVVSSPPDLTLDMFMSNSENILGIIGDFQSELSKIAELIGNKDEAALLTRIIQAKTQKEYLDQVQNE